MPSSTHPSPPQEDAMLPSNETLESEKSSRDPHLPDGKFETQPSSSGSPTLQSLRKDTGTALSGDENSDASSISEDDDQNFAVKFRDLNVNVSKFVSPNSGDPVSVKLAFWAQHPVQVTELKGGRSLPFDHTKLYYRTLPNGEKIPRKWLSYCEETNQVFCAACMAFGSKDHRDSKFVTGRDVSPKHIYTAVDTHENSMFHHEAVQAALNVREGGDIETLLNEKLVSERIKKVETQRLVLQRIIDIILFIAKQGIAFRGKDESVYLLEDEGAGRPNRGNFLELVLLVANYDPVMQTHVKRCISDSKTKKKKGKSGRGSLITFLSKTFVNKLIRIIASVGFDLIIGELKESGKFSLMVDSTQDVTAVDQLALCVHYVLHGKVHERLLHLSTSNDSSGEGLFNLLKLQLLKFGLMVSNVIGCSFDGASNMKGIYNGLQAQLKKANPLLIFTHCMGHVLNLVVADSTIHSLQAENLFGLVQESACFVTSSYKRMSVWTKHVREKHSAYKKLRKLQKIGATRWWSKSKALASIIDFNEPNLGSSTSKFVTFVTVLLEIATGDFDSNTKFVARTMLEKWTTFETLFTALIISDLFEVTSPVSEFLQSKSMDYLKAWSLVEELLEQMKSKRNDEIFDKLYKKCVQFACDLNTVFKDTLDIETDFVKKRVPIKKKMPGENARDESRDFSPHQRFRLPYYDIIDSAKESIEKRFVPNKELLLDCSWLDPQRYRDIASLDVDDFPSEVFLKLSELTHIDRHCLVRELKQFASQYDGFKATWRERYKQSSEPKKNQRNSDSESNSDSDSDDGNSDNESITVKGKSCGNEKKGNDEKCFQCLPCAFAVLYELSQHTTLFTNLYSAFKFVLSLSCTQVTCERVFSKLKILKTRLRSTLSKDLLSPLIFIFSEKDLFDNLNKDKVIDLVAASSEELRRKLSKS